MDPEKSAKFIKYSLILQIIILIGIGICEIIQLAEINRSQIQVIQHPNDWNYLFGYTSDALTVGLKIYYWLVLLISFAVLGWALESFDRRWKDLQYYNDNPRNIIMFILWSIATISSLILSSEANRLKICSESFYTYTVPQRLLLHCNAYMTSLILAYMFIFTLVIQLSFNFVIVRHKREISMKPPPNLQEPKKLKVRRSKRVSKKKGKRSSASYSVGTRLSIVTEDDEEKSNKSSKSNRSIKSIKSDNNKSDKNEFNSEMQVNSNA